ncbi:DUF3015 family protein [Hahella sp. SMD15-11]|uniref:DUF3015 family protein n=1 Tax=Thermohahella caldifontis TaxID=3142973 RepID=A0AB39USM9_9GAMM
MKKLILGAALVAAPFFASAHPAGCGLGTAVVFKNPQSWVEHVLAATTNGTSGNQTFGMTSGTLGCEDAGGPLAARVGEFLNSNLDQLAMDSAAGEGESLAALAELIGIQQQDEGLFKAQVKANFDRIFSSERTNSGDVYDALVGVLSSDARLAKYLG